MHTSTGAGLVSRGTTRKSRDRGGWLSGSVILALSDLQHRISFSRRVDTSTTCCNSDGCNERHGVGDPVSVEQHLFSLFGTLSIGSAYKTFNCTVTRPSLRVCKWRVSSALAACEATWNLTYATAGQLFMLIDEWYTRSEFGLQNGGQLTSLLWQHFYVLHSAMLGAFLPQNMLLHS